MSLSKTEKKNEENVMRYDETDIKSDVWRIKQTEL